MKMTRCGFFFAIVGLLIAPTSYADIAFSVSNSEDFSVQFYRIIFGEVASTMLGEDVAITSPDSVLAQMMLVWNETLNFLCIVMVIFNGIGWWINSNSESRKNQYDSFGLPIRFLIAMIGSVPLGHGYCAVQMVQFKALAAGIEQANTLANVVYDSMNAGGDITGAAAYLETDKVVNELFMSHICMQLLNNYEGEQLIDRNSYTRIAEDSDVNNGVFFSEYVMEVGEDSWWGDYDEKECGAYKFSRVEGDAYVTDGDAEAVLVDGLFDATLQMDIKLGDIAEDFIINTWGSNKLTDSDAISTYLESSETDIDAVKTSYKSDVYAALSDYTTNRQAYVDENQEAVPSLSSNFTAAQVGWIGLGATYILQSLQSQAHVKFLKANSFQQTQTINPDVYTIEDIQDALQKAGSVIGQYTPTGGGDSEVVDDLQSESWTLIGTAAISFVEGDGDILMNAADYGHTMIAIGEVILAFTILPESLKETLEDEAKEETTLPTSDIKRFLLHTGANILELGLGALVTIAYALILAGIYYAFYLPSIPLFHWIGGALGAIIAGVINVVLSPLHMIAHAFVDGHGIIGQHARQGYALMFSSFLRFPILVIGFVVVYPLILGAGKLLILLYSVYVNSLLDGYTTGIVSFIAVLALLGGLMATVIERCCTVMNELQDSAIRMIGQGTEAIGADAISRGSSDRFSTDSQSITSAGMEPSKQQHQQNIRSDAIEARNDLDNKL
jgi:conjugal transfer/type IV secretion protein DotA/TraY